MTINELMGIALKIEGVGYSYYSNLSKKSPEKIRTLFEELANEEREHSRIFEELLKQYEEKSIGMLNEEEVGYATTYAQEIIFPKLNDENIPSNLKEALKRAIEVEKDSIIFYTNIKALIPSLEVLNKIIEEERLHLKKLTLKLNDEDAFDMFSEGSMI
ncbi:ferritin-like domain-containing protein [Thermosipho atlanticus]|uniref:Rubrerythrin n=1 Tax=Thermosipho atlanticus DSM 15807 TaxID=1123380 RepID=A0A1M5RQA4_9BACT|nr:ferritin family protein [Thermosipho atlanticus]SHH28452.1 Rubrerythrin [Thermosipho atlanticus DSM 15807]